MRIQIGDRFDLILISKLLLTDSPLELSACSFSLLLHLAVFFFIFMFYSLLPITDSRLCTCADFIQCLKISFCIFQIPFKSLTSKLLLKVFLMTLKN